jgi:hypothetical protein
MKPLGAWALGILAFLGVLAIISRLLLFPDTASTIDNSVGGLSHLYNGAFFS